jgi:hypothetical protein
MGGALRLCWLQIAPELWPQGAGELDATSLLAGRFQEVGTCEVVIWKPRWSAFYRTPLEGHLTAGGVTTIVVAGCNYPNCRKATIYDASELDYRVLVASDAESGLDDRHLIEAEPSVWFMRRRPRPSSGLKTRSGSAAYFRRPPFGSIEPINASGLPGVHCMTEVAIDGRNLVCYHPGITVSRPNQQEGRVYNSGI